MDYEELIRLLSQMGTQQPAQGNAFVPNAGLNMGLLNSARLSSLTPSGVASSFNPEVLLASGVFDPARIGTIQQDYYRQQQADWLKSMMPYITPGQAPVASFSYSYDPYLNQNPDVQDLMVNTILPKIQSGEYTPDTAKSIIARGVADGTLPVNATDAPYLDNVVDTFSRELASFGKANAEYQAEEVNRQNKLGAMGGYIQGSMPTMDSARLEMYKALGVPQLALLPDVTETYKFNPEKFMDTATVERAMGYAQAAQPIIEAELPKAEKLATRGTQMSEYVASRVNAQEAENAKKKYIEQAKAKLPSYNEWYKSMPATKDRSNQAYKKFLEPKLKNIETVANNMAKRGFASTPKTGKVWTPEMVNPKLGSALRSMGGAQKMIELEKQKGGTKAAALSEALTKAGITPYQQFMLAFGAYGKKK